MSQIVETKPEPVIDLENPKVKLIDIKPIEVDINEEDQEEPDKTVEESNEKNYEPDDEPDDNDDYKTSKEKEKRRWKRILDNVTMETYDQIISKNIPATDYANLKWDTDHGLPIDWLDLKMSKRWFFDNMIFRNKSELNHSRLLVQKNLLELSRLLKIADKHIDECADPAVKERFMKGSYLRAVKRRNQVMNIWKAKDEEGCVQFLRENPIIGKYGKRVQETKPKKN